MTITYKPNAKYLDKGTDELKRCSICPFCGNYDEFAHSVFSGEIHTNRILPIGYETVYYKKNDSIWTKIKNTFFTGPIYHVYIFKCGKCGCEWKSDPIMVFDSKGAMVFDERAFYDGVEFKFVS